MWSRSNLLKLGGLLLLFLTVKGHHQGLAEGDVGEFESLKGPVGGFIQGLVVLSSGNGDPRSLR